MLNKREEKIMDEIYSLCKGDGKSLISAADFSRLFEEKERLPEEKLEKIFEDLREDDYAETLYSHRKGEKMYLFTLRAKGYCYPREKENKKRDKALLVVKSVASAIVAFLVGFILRRIFR